MTALGVQAGYVPFGYRYDEDTGVYSFCAAKACEKLSLLLYRNGQLSERFPFPEEERKGDVFSMGLLLPEDGAEYAYTYEADGVEFADPYGRAFVPERTWADGSWKRIVPRCLLSGEAEPLNGNEMEGSEASPKRSGQDRVVYRLHVRGFTQDASSGIEKDRRGTFYGVIDKLDYLQELGVTTVELFPVYEYEETLRLPAAGKTTETGMAAGKTAAACMGSAFVREGRAVHPDSGASAPAVNYWGFTKEALRFSIRNSYGGRRGYFDLLSALHEKGMELCADLYFDGTEDIAYVREVLRIWIFLYQADCLHLIGRPPLEGILRDPYLAHASIWCDRCPETGKSPFSDARAKSRPGQKIHLSEYNREFQHVMRCFLKGDSGFTEAAFQNLTEVPEGYGRIHYMANADGFTLLDMLSYNKKHNEANGEFGRDGTEENDSWNCGEEGNCRKKQVRELRERLWKNAVLMTVLSQGTPLFLSGDEMGHTKSGNNNSWCQDNRTEWINWKDCKRNAWRIDYIKALLALRRAHPVFQRREKLRESDWKGCGLPELSCHGESAWQLSPEGAGRLGIVYCGAYAAKPDGSPDDSFYLGFNMHWEPHRLALPKLPEGTDWELLLDTGAGEQKKAGRPSAEKAPQEPEHSLSKGLALGETQKVLGKEILLMPRSAVLLIGRTGKHQESIPGRSKKREKKARGRN